MSKTVVIHQPDFAPYLGFFDRFLYSDLYIILDHVQFVHSNNSWSHRDKIKTNNGPQWITISIKKTSRYTPISEIIMSDNNWKDRNLNLIKQNYRKAPYFKEIITLIERLFATETKLLSEFNIKWIKEINKILDIKV